ncbi:MAG: deoxyribose-phosphate aldolase [Saprospiraceae bacterium]|nr:deoxyribose-phosphate aldolase [Saprospiraceae bacterium]
MSVIASYLEHTILKPDCTLNEVRRVCEEALQHGFAAVCIPPFFVRDARRFLGEEKAPRLATVVGFPLGYNAIAAKSEEIRRATEDGADDIDAVINIAALKSGNWNHVRHDIDGLSRATHMRGRTLKLILECGLLTADEIRQVAQIAREFNVAFLKTGTGFNGFPATVDMVRQLRQLTSADMRIKAAGGIRTRALAEALIAAGADRIGTSASLTIIAEPG